MTDLPELATCQRAFAEHIAAADATIDRQAQRIAELERALGELVALEDLKDEFDTLARRDYLDNHVNPFTEAELARYRFILDERSSRRLHRAWAAARALARGIASPEGIETQGGSTAERPEPGPAGARPSKGFLKGESPQATWPFAQDDKGTE